MSFSPEEVNVSPPCFFVDNSQVEDSQLCIRSRSDQYLTILKQLPISSRVSSNAVTSVDEKNGALVSEDMKFVSCPGRGGENDGQEVGDRQSFGQGRTGDGQGRGGGEGGDGDGGHSGGGHSGGHSGGGHGNGGGSGGGDGGDDGDNDGNDGADVEEDEGEGNEPSQPTSTSSDSIPKLIRPEAMITGDRWREGGLPASEVRRDVHGRHLSDSSLSSTGGGDARIVTPPGNSADNHSEASTCIVGQGGDVASDLSEAPTISDEKKSSSSGLDSKSKKGSTTGSSSSYHGDLSSLSSGSSQPTPPEVRKHLPLHAMFKTQSSSDVSSGSAGSKEGKRVSHVVGFKWWSVESEPAKGTDDSDVVCSSQEDMFASSQGHKGHVQKEHHPQSRSLEETHFASPQHQSTPVEDEEKKAESKEQDHSGKLLYKQVLTKRQTSTPFGGTSGEFLPTPYSQGTPIERFNSLQFSGDTTGFVKDTSSSSSSDKIPPSPEASMSVPMLIPSSPTAANEEKSDERKRKSSSDDEESPEGLAKKEGRSQQLTKGNTEKEEKPEMSRAAEALLLEEYTEHSAGPTVQVQKGKLEDVPTDEEDILLPLWQQELLKEERFTADGKRTLSSKSASSEFIQQESQAHSMKQWQSITSAFESSSSTSESKRVQQTEWPKTASGSREQLVDISSPEDNAVMYPKTDYPLHGPAAKPAQQEPSLSPSSLAVDPFVVVEVSKTDVTQESLAAPGPTQPELSEDLFRPNVTLDSDRGASRQEDISDKSDDQQMEGAAEAEGSQVEAYQFSLHLTQSQVDTQLPPSVATSQTTKDAFKLPSTEEGEKSSECREASQREEVAVLTKQDSSFVVRSQSQSVLAPLVQESAQTSHVQAKKDKVLEQCGTADGPQLSVALKDVSCNEDSSQKDKAEIEGRKTTHKDTTCPPIGDDQVGFTPPEHPLEKPKPSADNKDAGGGAPLSKQNEPPVEQTAGENVMPARKPIKPRLPATIFSESSVESGSEAGFHFSIPKDPVPLQPVSSTTPPPMRPFRCDTPDSEERVAGPALIRDGMPVITETPGMSSQAPRPPFLTVSMPRRESLEGGSDNSEPAFHFESAIQPIAMAPAGSASPQTPPRESPLSLFIRARQVVGNTKKRELESDSDSDSDPFAFTARDDVPEPPKKRSKRTPGVSGRREIGKVRDDLSVARENHHGDSTRILVEGPRSSANKSFGERSGQGEETKEMEEDANRSLSLDKPNVKRGLNDNSESSESGELGERLKRARKEEQLGLDTTAHGSLEPTYFQQITHTRLVTTVTTVVQRIVTVKIVNKASGEVVEVISYEDNEQPKVERDEKDNKEVHEFVEYYSVDGSRVKLTSELPKKQEQPQQQPRTSPRTRSSKSTVTAKSASTAVFQVSEPGETAFRSDNGNTCRGATSGERKESHQKAQEGESVKTNAENPPTITRQDTVPVVEDASRQRSSSSDSPVAAGSRVLAKWLDGYFYPGKVTAGPNKNGRYAVTFDDGDKRRIPRENIIIKDILPAGQSVMAQGEGEFDFYEEGTIVGHYRNEGGRGYEIQIQSGAIWRFPVSKIILSEQQAASILSSSEGSLNATSGSSISIGIHSLRSKTEGSSTGSTLSPRNLTKASGSGVGDTARDTSCKDTSESSSDEKRRARKASRPSTSIAVAVEEPASPSRDVTPKSTRKSSRKVKERTRRNGQRIAESGSEASCDERAKGAGNGRHHVRRGLSSTFGGMSPGKPLASEPTELPTRRSPRKHLNKKDTEGATRSSSEEDLEPGPLPQNRNVFAGLAFLVTGVVKDKSTHEESDSECERVAFNRGHLKRQIETGGGVVLSSFPGSQISAADCFLVSNTHQRTQKYFQSLAAGIPCVSHVWIIDCCASNKRLNYQKYLLPAGYSLEEGEVVECRTRRNIFGNMRVYLHGSQHFKETWSSVLLAAGCKMVTKLPNRLSRTLETEGLDYQCDVVICGDNKLPASVKYATNILQVPVVSLEWLLQSLISGRQLCFDSHPKYHYKNA